MAHGWRKRDSIHETPDVSYITNPDVAHEESDVAVRPLLWFVGGLTFFTIVVCAAVLLMFIYFNGREESQELEASPLARQGAERLPPEPRLQLAPGFAVTTDDGKEHDLSYNAKTDSVPQPQSEYLVLRDEWRHELEDYGWADQQAGAVRVPINEAMRRYLQRRQTGQTATAGGQQSAPAATTPPPNTNSEPTDQKRH
jgi:hypothetical protein